MLVAVVLMLWFSVSALCWWGCWLLIKRIQKWLDERMKRP